MPGHRRLGDSLCVPVPRVRTQVNPKECKVDAVHAVATERDSGCHLIFAPGLEPRTCVSVSSRIWKRGTPACSRTDVRSFGVLAIEKKCIIFSRLYRGCMVVLNMSS